MNLWTQLPALLGVLTGAFVSYVFTNFAERARWRRGLSIRWDERRLSAYVDYVNSTKVSVNIVVLVLAGKGIVEANNSLEESEGLAMLSDAEGERSVKLEGVLMLGNTETIAAARELTRQLYRLYSFARGELPVTPQIWDEAYSAYRLARTRFHDAARNSLGVPQADMGDRSVWLEHLTESQDKSGNRQSRG